MANTNGPNHDLLVWLDMEMTGLDPRICVPLEVAMIVTSSDLEELDTLELQIWQSENTLSSMEPFVRKMHTDNGLLEKVRASTVGITDAERAMMKFLTRWSKYREGILAGNTIHQDRRFLEAYFPTFDNYLHYRMVDVSSIKELVKRWSPSASFTKQASLHTALADIRASIAELKHYKKFMFREPSASLAS